MDKESYIKGAVSAGQTLGEAEALWVKSTITKGLILDFVSDMVADFLYYDRKECEQLPLGAIEEAIDSGVITVDEIVAKFRTEVDTS